MVVWNEKHTDTINCIDCNSSGIVISGGEDKSVQVWNFTTQAVVASIENFKDEVSALRFNPNNQNHFIASSGDSITLYDVRNVKKSLLHRVILSNEDDAINDVDISSCGEWCAIASDDKYLRLFEFTTEFIANLDGHENLVTCCKFVADTDDDVPAVLSGGCDCNVILHELNGRQLLPVSQNIDLCVIGSTLVNPPFVHCIATNGDVGVCGLENGMLLLLDLKPLDIIAESSYHSLAVSQAVFLNNATLCSSSNECVIATWDIAQDSFELKSAVPHTSKINSMCCYTNNLIIADLSNAITSFCTDLP